MARGDAYTLNGTTIKRPTSFKIEKYKLTTANRLASGDMAADVIAKKRKFYFTYDAITNAELNKILDALWENDSYFTSFTYIENGAQKEVTVYPGSIPAELYRPEDMWIWKNVSFDLIER